MKFAKHRQSCNLLFYVTRFRAENRERLEQNQRAQFAGLAASQWLAMRLQLIGVVMVTGVATVAVIEHTYSTVEAGMQTNLFSNCAQPVRTEASYLVDGSQTLLACLSLLGILLFLTM